MTRPPRWVWQVLAYLAVTGAFGYTLTEIRDTNAVQCADRRDGREALRATVTEAFRPGTPTNFSAIPSFADLDPATQRFLNDLADALASGSSRTEVRDRILESIPPIECR